MGLLVCAGAGLFYPDHLFMDLGPVKAERFGKGDKKNGGWKCLGLRPHTPAIPHTHTATHPHTPAPFWDPIENHWESLKKCSLVE